MILLCGHYEGLDERVRQLVVTDEISIGDYVLTGGELPAMVIVDAVVRHIPGVLGAEGGAERESHADGILEGAHYTRPVEFRGLSVPQVLQDGNHAAIERWRREDGLRRTWRYRPDLLLKAQLYRRRALSAGEVRRRGRCAAPRSSIGRSADMTPNIGTIEKNRRKLLLSGAGIVGYTQI